LNNDTVLGAVVFVVMVVTVVVAVVAAMTMGDE
jgi:hypothetical protein